MRVVDFSYTEINDALTYRHYKDQSPQKLLPYLKNNREKITNFYPKFKSALIYLYHYNYPSIDFNLKNGLKLSKLFWHIDYHLLVKHHLNSIKNYLSKKLNTSDILPIVDTSPILERDLAVRSNLGFWGKNNMFIHPIYGSFVIIGSLLLPQKLDLKTRPPVENLCKNCNRCLENCPTNALSDHKIDLTKCISYFTLVSKDILPPINYQKSRFILGCDNCQKQCPYNKTEKTVFPSKSFLISFFNQNILDLISFLNPLSNGKFNDYFQNTGLVHLGKKRLLKNLYPYL